MAQPSQQRGSFAALRQFVRERAPVERCELCSAKLAPDHQHLVEPSSRQLVCCCDACAILFSNQGDTRYRRVPRRVRALPDFRITDAQWDSLLIPISLAFFYASTPAGRVVALYPGPAGAIESLLDLGAWSDLARENPILGQLEPDVEALLVHRASGAREYYIAPIDICYELVGLIRTNWRGLSGGSEVWEEIGRFFARLKERA
jgi:hypothetical protein